MKKTINAPVHLDTLLEALADLELPSRLDEVREDVECATTVETVADFNVNLQAARAKLASMLAQVDTLLNPKATKMER